MVIDPAELALWVLTPGGLETAQRLRHAWPRLTLWTASRLAEGAADGQPFDGLGKTVRREFSRYKGHVFCMSTGIVVRTIAPLLHHKSTDPAVVVVDDRGRFVISLVSGHLGGANRLAQALAECIGATPVITTATDVQGKPAIDLLAMARQLTIENPSAIKGVNMALLQDDPVPLHDPGGYLQGLLPKTQPLDIPSTARDSMGVYVDDRECDLPAEILVLRPPSLVAGIGCNRGTPCGEIRDLLATTLGQAGLAIESIATIATIDLKADEPGLLELARQLRVPLTFYTRQALTGVRGVSTPSALVAHHVGVESVCEAAAILAARQGPLIIPKTKTRNATLAIARRGFTSSGSALET